MRPNDQLTPFLGFAPDADPTTPGVLTDTTAMIASTRGLRAFPFGARVDAAPGPAGTNANFSAYPQGYCEGLWGGPDPSGYGMVLCKTNRAGTPKIYALRQNSNVTAALFWGNWDDVTPVGATLREGPFVFTKFGNYVLFTGGYMIGGTFRSSLCYLGSTTAVSGYVTAAPQAITVVSASRFALLFNYTATWGGFTDGWVCSARDDHTNWTPSPTTLCAYGRLVESDGPITAAHAFGDDVIVCKHNSLYMGRFEPGNAEVWVWEKISNSAGAQNQRCVASDREGRIYMLGNDDLYIWDGAQVKGLMGGVLRTWFRDNVVWSYATQGSAAPSTHIVYDPMREVLIINAESRLVAGVMLTISFCPRSKLWAYATTTNEAVALGPVGVVGWPASPELFAIRSSSSFGAANTTANRYLYEFSSAQPAGGGICGFTTGDYGSDFFESELKTVRVRDIAGNTSYTHRRGWSMKRPDLLSSLTTAVAGTTAKSDGAYDMRQSSKWHRMRFEFSGHAEVTGINLDITRQGAK